MGRVLVLKNRLGSNWMCFCMLATRGRVMPLKERRKDAKDSYSVSISDPCSVHDLSTFPRERNHDSSATSFTRNSRDMNSRLVKPMQYSSAPTYFVSRVKQPIASLRANLSLGTRIFFSSFDS